MNKYDIFCVIIDRSVISHKNNAFDMHNDKYIYLYFDLVRKRKTDRMYLYFGSKRAIHKSRTVVCMFVWSSSKIDILFEHTESLLRLI